MASKFKLPKDRPSIIAGADLMRIEAKVSNGKYTVMVTTPLSSMVAEVADKDIAEQLYLKISKRFLETIESELDFFKSDMGL